MKVLLKQFATGKFLKAPGLWTSDSANAIDFKTAPAALDFSHSHGYRSTVIVLKFADGRYDMDLKNCC
jgi:hypothetical protein